MKLLNSSLAVQQFNFFSISIGMSEADRVIQFVLRSENIIFKYVQKDSSAGVVDFEGKVKRLFKYKII